VKNDDDGDNSFVNHSFSYSLARAPGFVPEQITCGCCNFTNLVNPAKQSLINFTMRHTPVLLVFIFVFAACKKNKTPAPEPTKFYVGNKVKNVQAARLYTKNGIVSNSATVQAYINEFDRYLFEDGFTLNDPEFTRFRYISEDSFFVTGVTLPAGLKRLQASTYDYFAGIYRDIVLDTAALLPGMQKYTRYYPKIGSNGSTYFETDLPVYIFKKRSDTLFFPIVRYVIISRRPGFASLVTDRFNNVFNPAGAARLGDTDTLLVQQLELVLPKE
jgi:hypothetical protein